MIFLSKQKMETYFGDPFDGGAEGRVFNAGDSIVAKLFYHSLRINRYNIDDLLQFKDIKTNNFAFAQELIYYPFRIGGVLMPKVPGKQLIGWNLYNLPIEDLINSLIDLILAIEEISYYGVKVDYDVSSQNMLYDGLSFYLIDTAGYDRGVFPYEELYNFNRTEILIVIYRKILALSRIYDYLQKMHGFNDLFTSGLLMADPREVLGELKASLEMYLGEIINTFSEANAMMRK